MCGIAGIVSNHSVPGVRRLSDMAQAMRHRGPDDAGSYLLSGERGGLAACRLAIRDLSPAGHMPMSNEAGTVCITYNGEIYNADELRRELGSLGYAFRSHSDTEVILKGYEAWGEAVVERLRGMFAFAVLDARQGEGRERLFLARDRLGVKPLYYGRSADAFLFASELRSLQSSALLSRELSPAAVAGYLMTGSVPSPLTIYREARSLPPGCVMSLELGRTLDPRIRRYWSLPEVNRDVNEAEAVERVRALLEEAVRIRLVSDVPLGAFLSGGMDSSAVVALMRRATNGTLRTCSLVFDEASYSEAPYALAAARAVGAEHYERRITPLEVAGELDAVLRAMDQPTVDGVNTYFVSQTARQAGLTVALSGLGGDELFGGYHTTFGGVPRLLTALRLARVLPGGRGAAQLAARRRPVHAKLEDALSRPATPASAYLARRGLFAPGEVRNLLPPEIWQAARDTFDPVEHIVAASGAAHDDLFDWVSRAELATYTRDQLLRDTDVMSMAHSLEVRVPLLDHRLVEYVLGLPAALKRRGAGPKPLLRRALVDLLPPDMDRPKQGFTFPFDRWLRGPLRPRLEAVFAAGGGSRWLQPETVDRVWAGYLAGRVHWSRPWALAVLQLFCAESAAQPAAEAALGRGG